MLRIAIGGIFTECNHLGGMPIDLNWFERYELLRGEELLACRSGVVGGMLRTLRKKDLQPVPLLFASTCPGGPVTSDCYAQLKNEFLSRLDDALPVDGVLLPLHGAMTVQDVWDPEGDLIEEVRQRVGDAVIVATLDMHAQVTERMVGNANALVAWETYPHRDADTTGERGAELMSQAVTGAVRPQMVMAKVPVITSGFHGSTDGNGPFASVMRSAKELEHHAHVLSTSVFLGHPYLDLPQMGSGGLVVTDGDAAKAMLLARQLADDYWNRRHDLEPEVVTPDDAIRIARQAGRGPHLLLEAADCCGGGASGDSAAALKSLVANARDCVALVPVVDAPAAAACHEAGQDRCLTIALGHHHDPRWGTPLTVTARVERLSDGTFRYRGGIWDNVEGHMGPTAVLAIDHIRVLVTTFATYDWSDEQFRSQGLDPSRADFIVAKNPMNYRNAYLDLARTIQVLDTPGPTPATLRHAPFKNLEHPFFPAHDTANGQPLLLRGYGT